VYIQENDEGLAVLKNSIQLILLLQVIVEEENQKNLYFFDSNWFMV